MACLPPAEFVKKAIDAGEAKIFMSAKDTVIRAYMAGALLALAAAFAVTVTHSTGQPLIGALLFPVGFSMLYLLGVFFFTTFEHSVVNMFLFPSALIMGGFSLVDYLIWNEIPTLLGNIVGGIAFTGLMLYSTHARPNVAAPAPVAAAE